MKKCLTLLVVVFISCGSETNKQGNQLQLIIEPPDVRIRDLSFSSKHDECTLTIYNNTKRTISSLEWSVWSYYLRLGHTARTTDDFKDLNLDFVNNTNIPPGENKIVVGLVQGSNDIGEIKHAHAAILRIDFADNAYWMFWPPDINRNATDEEKRERIRQIDETGLTKSKDNP